MSGNRYKTQIWTLDFGSQYTQLITRKTRELGFSTKIFTLDDIKTKFNKNIYPRALVLSGGPQSIQADRIDYAFIFKNKKLPVLGICYGMHVLAKCFKSTIKTGKIGEYGHAVVEVTNSYSIRNCPAKTNVWMSHGDYLGNIPTDFNMVMKSDNGYIAGIRHKKRPLLAFQFHPEVKHTEHGKDLLYHFYKDIAGLKEDWSSAEMLKKTMDLVKSVGDAKVLCAFSGGVDSLVAATLASKVIDKNLFCFFVDNGLLRPQDYHHINTLKKETNLNINIIDAKLEFLTKLKGISDPEKKRKIIGNTFIEVFEKKVRQYEKQHKIHFKYLLQGTLYPDVIESFSPHKKGGKSETIKSHHNVGGLPDRMKLKLLEPLRYLFKDEVRKLGVELKLKNEWIYRHPFPGPGIAIRVLNELNTSSIKKVQQSDQILFEELHSSKLYQSVWQAFTVYLPVLTVGVKGDARVYEGVICLRIVESQDGMTASWSDLPNIFLSKVSSRITNEVKGITRVVYDITSKPPGTIEWE